MTTPTNGNGQIKIPKWAWATVVAGGLTIVSWAGFVTSKLAAIEARMANWDRQAALVDEIRAEQLRGGYTLYSMGDAQGRLLKLELSLQRLEEDVKDILKRKSQP
jgi:hypothetical protein